MAQTAQEMRQRFESADAAAQDDALPAGFEELADIEMRGESEMLTMDGSVMGSPQYMPPEQAHGRVADLDERSDIFALGGILYAILTLRPPLGGKTVLEVLENAKRAKVKEPTRYNPRNSTTSDARSSAADSDNEIALPHCPGRQIPDALAAVSMKALARDPDERYQSVVDFSNDLEKWRGGFATSAQHISLAGNFRLLIKRHKAGVIAACLGIVLTTVLIVGFLLYTKANTSAQRPPILLGGDEDIWADLLFTLTPELVEQTGHGWRMDRGRLHSARAVYGVVPMPGRYTNASYQAFFKIQQTSIDQGLPIVLPVGERMTGIDLDTWSGKYTGLVVVDIKEIKDLPGVVNGKQITDTNIHELEVTVQLADANATINVSLDNSPLYKWTGQYASLSQHSAWATEPRVIGLGALTPNWAIHEVKVRRLAEAR